MRDPDPKTTLREIREYFASSHESERKIAARIGVSQTTIWAWLAGKQHPAAESVARLTPLEEVIGVIHDLSVF
jgi:transcriptional regulator with XRE-family HTH domain